MRLSEFVVGLVKAGGHSHDAQAAKMAERWGIVVSFVIIYTALVSQMQLQEITLVQKRIWAW